MSNLRSALLAGVATLGLGSAALAADMPVKAPMYQNIGASPFNWSGVYIGLEAGWGTSSVDLGANGSFLANETLVNTNPGSLGSHASGGVGGFTLALREQPAGSPFVFGIKGAFDLTGINSAGATILNTQNTQNVAQPVGAVSIPWDARIMGELGWSPTQKVLIFIDGGGACGDIKMNAAVTTAFVSSALSNENVHCGWTGGAGFKYALAPNIILGFDWDYVNLGHDGLTVNAGGPQSATFNFDSSAAYNKFMGTLEVKF